MKRKNRIRIISLACILLMCGCGQNAGSDTALTESSTETPATVAEEPLPEEKDKKEIPISFNTAAVLTYPDALKVTYGDTTVAARVDKVSWAYAVNDLEWSSVEEENFSSIDGPYDEMLWSNPQTSGLTLSFEGWSQPDLVVYVYRYPLSNWVEDPEKETDGHVIRDAIEHMDDYTEYEILNRALPTEDGFVVSTPMGDTGGYVYEVKAVWDRDLYRGSAIYSFIIQ